MGKEEAGCHLGVRSKRHRAELDSRVDCWVDDDRIQTATKYAKHSKNSGLRHARGHGYAVNTYTF